jgi:predicted TIM-barrel fold metal-dependent hydrolase
MPINSNTGFVVALSVPGSTKHNTLKLVNEPQVIIDGHMHINSGRCAPMPLLWEQIPVLGWIKTRRSIVEGAAYVVSVRAAKTQAKATDMVAVEAVALNQSAYADQTRFPIGATQQRLSPMIVMPMDMEFAHIDGYTGEHIYKLLHERYFHEWRDENGQWHRNLLSVDKHPEVVFDHRLNQYTWRGVLLVQQKGDYYWYHDRKSLDHDGRKAVWLHPQEFKMYEKWDRQVERTKLAVLQNPWALVPMFHYDPRRWRTQWQPPFDDVATPSKPGLFIGFKMYTALGYKPLDERLPKLADYYARCAQEGIPIVCHCSAGGVRSIDRNLYYELEKDSAKRKKYARRFWFDNPVGYYYDHYVSPMAWHEQVLSKHKSLRLCLAHFGGNGDEWKEWRLYCLMGTQDPANPKSPYDLRIEWFDDPQNGAWIKKIIELMGSCPNFYTDISYHMLSQSKEELRLLLTRHPKIKERIIFGTDWYMTLLDKYDYPKYILEAKQVLDDLSQDRNINDDLWERFTKINPMTFYRLQEIADSFVQGVKNTCSDLEDAYPKLKLKENQFTNGAKIIKKVRI